MPLLPPKYASNSAWNKHVTVIGTGLGDTFSTPVFANDSWGLGAVGTTVVVDTKSNPGSSGRVEYTISDANKIFNGTAIWAPMHTGSITGSIESYNMNAVIAFRVIAESGIVKVDFRASTL